MKALSGQMFARQSAMHRYSAESIAKTAVHATGGNALQGVTSCLSLSDLFTGRQTEHLLVSEKTAECLHAMKHYKSTNP